MPDPEELQRYAHWLRWITLLKSLDEATAHFLIKEETVFKALYFPLFSQFFYQCKRRAQCYLSVIYNLNNFDG